VASKNCLSQKIVCTQIDLNIRTCCMNNFQPLGVVTVNMISKLKSLSPNIDSVIYHLFEVEI
jgi:hypothetical protein